MSDDSRRQAMLAVEAQVWFIGRRIRQKVQVIADEIAPGLSPNGYALLESLDRHGRSRQGDLVDALTLDKGSVSRLVQEVVELGLVEKEADPADGRAVLLSLSDHGKERMDEIRVRRRAAYRDRLADWSTEELVALSDTLARYNSAMEG